MSAKKLYLRSFGCQMNDYDSNRIVDLLGEAMQLEKTDDLNEADVVVLNTCSIREKAQEKVFSDLGRIREAKRDRPDMMIAVGGCVASQEGAGIVKRAPWVDVVFGPQTMHRLPEMLGERARTGKPQVDVSFPEIEKFDHLPAPRAEGAAAFVSIMEGCSKYCTYCVVPYTRGEEISRPLVDVLVEVAQLADQGVKEVTLLGQNVNAYRGVTPEGDTADFAMLLEYVSEIDGIERIRYTTSHPREFTQRLIDAYTKLPKLVSHVHLPVQAGSDRILTAMKRGYSVLEYKSIIRRLKAARPGIAIATDFIVGFPGETEEDFEETLDVVSKCGYDTAFTFLYSRRSGTPAAEMEQIPQDVAKERFNRLLALVQQEGRIRSSRFEGSVQEVLVEEESREKGIFTGRTEYNLLVHFPGTADLLGKYVKVSLDECHGFYYMGSLVEE